MKFPKIYRLQWFASYWSGAAHPFYCNPKKRNLRSLAKIKRGHDGALSLTLRYSGGLGYLFERDNDKRFVLKFKI